MAKKISVHIKSVFVRPEQFTDLKKKKNPTNHDLTIEVGIPVDPNQKIEKSRSRPQKWAELC